MNAGYSYLNQLRAFSRNVRLYIITVAVIGFTVLGMQAVLFAVYVSSLKRTT
jgi:hypothetical protein